tara:strand:+ start:4400 stop:5197 length:798 start_codon:yes stop_codon:yes gene_type:complete
VLISIHIPKTAGTAWRLMIEANAGQQASFVSVEARDRNDTATRALALIDSGQEDEARMLVEAAGCQMIHGHRADAFLKLFPNAPAIIWLREPKPRLLSEYTHLKTFRREEGKLGQAIHAGEADLGDLARARSQIYTRLEARLKEHPGGYIAMLTERSDQAARTFHAALGWRGRLARRNVAPRMSGETLDALVDGQNEALDEILASDRSIHDQWRQLWDSGEAGERAMQLLQAGPLRQPPPLRHYLRRLAGIGKERLGRALGRDWR